ncbi:MAG: hypothetical protein LBH74_06685 [Nitrososphaerota archaeon]|nr:hypothetical protein [Nitrososphaerota archaeon]
MVCSKNIDERGLSRTIYKLGTSAEFSSKECKAKLSAIKMGQKSSTDQIHMDNVE